MRKVFKTAIIGLGRAAYGYELDPLVSSKIKFPTHFSVLSKHKGYQLVAASDINPKALKIFSRKVTNVSIYGDWKKMLTATKPEFLVVSTNTKSHVEICKEAIRFGVKNILCEKPISYDYYSAKSLVTLALKNNVFLSFNYFRAFNTSYIRLESKLKKGVFGKPFSFNIKYCRGIYNNCTHALQIIDTLFGKIQQVHYLNGRLSAGDPTVNFAALFDSGVSGFFHGIIGDYSIFEIELFYERARLLINNDGLVISNKLGEIQKVTKKNELKIDSGFYPVYENIYNHLAYKEKLLFESKDALYLMKEVHKILNIKK